MSIRAAQRLRKLTPWHHNAAYLIAAGLNYSEVAEEIGGHPAYLGRLVNYSQLFQVILYFYRDEINEKRQAETLAKFEGKILKRHQRRQSRSRKSSSPQSIASPSAAPIPPGQMKTDRGSSAPQLQPAMSQSPMPAGQVPPSRQSWQDLIAKRREETRYAWQAADGTATGGRPR